MIRKANATWKGTGLEGEGTLNSTSGVLKETPYNFVARFKSEDGKAGTNPEELIAAAHAGCFSMALSFKLVAAGFTADEIKTEAVMELVNDGGWVAKTITLNTNAKVPGISAEQFAELANAAKTGCPVSRLVNCEIILNAKVNS